MFIIICAIRVQRSRRSAADDASGVYNATMPPVHWSTSFGDDNISMNMDRTIHNQFSLSTGKSIML